MKNDDLVYCIKGNWCNIILRYIGGIVFSFIEFVIKVFGLSYLCLYVFIDFFYILYIYIRNRVREGMVFVVMKLDEFFICIV